MIKAPQDGKAIFKPVKADTGRKEELLLYVPKSNKIAPVFV